jgi:hypothetical protein
LQVDLDQLEVQALFQENQARAMGIGAHPRGEQLHLRGIRHELVPSLRPAFFAIWPSLRPGPRVAQGRRVFKDPHAGLRAARRAISFAYLIFDQASALST